MEPPLKDIYHLYKPLRNLARKCDLGSGLLACYRFLQFLDFNLPLPDGFAHPGLRTERDRWRLGLFQWEFEILIRELILNAATSDGRRITKWSDVAKLMNAIKKLENDKWAETERNQDDVLYELVRIAHRQFPWQTGLNTAFIARYHWLYRQPGLLEAVQSRYGMGPTELFQIGFSLVGHFIKQPIAKTPLRNQINSVDQETTDRFIAHFSMTMDHARNEYKRFAQYNINWPYTFNPLRQRPLLILEDGHLFCPIPTFLIRRLTSEVYYDLISEQDSFSRSYGPAVQRLIGHSAQSANSEGVFEIREERRFGPKKAKKDSIDWIITDASGHLFVECKGARIKFQGISDLTDQQFIIQEFHRIKSFAVQAYKTLALALAGEYPHWQNDGRPKYVMVVTLEDWQSFGLHVDRHVLAPLRADLAAEGVDPRIVDSCPLSFCAVADFEAAMHVAANVGIDNLFRKKNEGEYPQWAMGTFLSNNFRDELAGFKADAFNAEWRLLGTPAEV